MNNGSREECVFVVVSKSWYLPVCQRMVMPGLSCVMD